VRTHVCMCMCRCMWERSYACARACIHARMRSCV